MYHYFPVNLNLRSRKCLVVGGGRVAERRVKALLQCGAKVSVVSPTLTEELRRLADASAVDHLNHHYTPDDLNGCFMVISATDDHEVNLRVADDCIAHNVLVNVVDDPARSHFIVPSILRRGSLCIAISTEGRSPLLAKRIREMLETSFGPEYADFLELMGEVRDRLIKNIPDGETRRKVFECLVDSDILELIRKGEKGLIEERIAQCLQL